MKAARIRIGGWLLARGRAMQGLHLEQTAAIGPVQPDGDRRLVVQKGIAVVVSSHARDRYAERTGRMLTGRILDDELRSVWEHAVVSIEPPNWLNRAQAAGEPLQIYASIADMVFPLVSYEGQANCFVATTVLTPDGPPKYRGRPAKSTPRFSRRKFR